jgi:ATP-dependent Clp endopeptidase proteolytic subunit ClpP
MSSSVARLRGFWFVGVGGQAADIDIHAREILSTREILNEILAEATGQPREKIERDVDCDYIMDSRQAVEYGIVDRVIGKRDLPGGVPTHNGNPRNGTGY